MADEGGLAGDLDDVEGGAENGGEEGGVGESGGCAIGGNFAVPEKEDARGPGGG